MHQQKVNFSGIQVFKVLYSGTMLVEEHITHTPMTAPVYVKVNDVCFLCLRTSSMSERRAYWEMSSKVTRVELVGMRHRGHPFGERVQTACSKRNPAQDWNTLKCSTECDDQHTHIHKQTREVQSFCSRSSLHCGSFLGLPFRFLHIKIG